ncbi:hypothetical protein [Pseudoruegeria sp. HB172150]|uniref:hypothetical protein n=1 Tax=Pseudoruegeria sp. HB172150 TaxID=2721164 RepID=UPI001C12F5C4|nr:hypothetical protein [Pseudoruegeria sp. HB172150]
MAEIPRIMVLEPDLALTFSDLQADGTAHLLRQGVTGIGANSRGIAGIFAMIRMLGALTGCEVATSNLIAGYQRPLTELAAATEGRKRPIVYLEDRPGWEMIPAVSSSRIIEIKSPLILQPDPAALTNGLDAIRRCAARLTKDRPMSEHTAAELSPGLMLRVSS